MKPVLFRFLLLDPSQSILLVRDQFRMRLAAKTDANNCDEMTSAHGQIVPYGMLQLLMRLQEEIGVPCLHITHDIVTLQAISDEVVVMFQGKVAEQGPKSEILKPPHPDYTKVPLSSATKTDPDWLTGLMEGRAAALPEIIFGPKGSCAAAIQERRRRCLKDSSCHGIKLIDQIRIPGFGSGYDGMLQCAIASLFAEWPFRPQIRSQICDKTLGLLSVANERGNDLGNVDFSVFRMPAVEIRHHRDRRVADLRLSGELGFRHVRHADHIASPRLPVQFGFRQSRKLWSFHRQIGARRSNTHSGTARRIRAGQGQLPACRIGDRNMAYATLAEEGLAAGECPVDELIDDNEITRRGVLPQ